jgi:hypothetical protein
VETPTTSNAGRQLSRVAFALLASAFALPSPSARAEGPVATGAAYTDTSPPPIEVAPDFHFDAPEVCTACSSEADNLAPAPFWIDNAWRGVSLADLPLDSGLDGPGLEAMLRETNPADLTETLSVSFVSVTGPRLLVLFIGRAPRFTDARTASPNRHGKKPRAGLGIVVLSWVPALGRSDLPSLADFAHHEEHALADLAPRLRVSLADRATVLDFPGLGLRRVFPSGVGALDGVRAFPDLASLTPITERARVSTKGAFERLAGPSWARNLPYIPFQVPWVSTTKAPIISERLFYAVTPLAFHAWPGKTFIRAFNSHGCVTLRDPDLIELAAFVFGASAPLPLVIRESAFDDARHPFPHEDQLHWRLVNTGSPERPAFQLRGNLYYLERLRQPIPDVSALVGRFMDSENRAYKAGRLSRAPDAGIPDALTP